MVKPQRASPPPLVALLIVGWIQYRIAVHRPPTTRSTALGCAIASASLLVLVASAHEFRKMRTTVDPRAAARPSALVISGPQTWSRNAMYLGMAGLLAAHAVARRSVLAFLAVGGFVVWVDRAHVRHEEATLAAIFMHEYEQYRSEVRRWL